MPRKTCETRISEAEQVMIAQEKGTVIATAAQLAKEYSGFKVEGLDFRLATLRNLMSRLYGVPGIEEFNRGYGA